MDDGINGRARHLLRTLVAEYIRHGKPVGSRTLSRQSGLDLSAATIRNVMADLEEAGFIHAPHTSAGRIPTNQGYRFFVDSLITSRGGEGEGEEGAEHPEPVIGIQPLLQEGGTRQTVSSASGLVSALTNFAGVVTVPKRSSFAFRHIDFAQLGERQVMAILVFEDGEVENRLLETDRAFEPRQLERAANFLNREYAGLLLPEIRQRLVADMASAKQEMDTLMEAAIGVARAAFKVQDDPDVVVSGQANLLQYRDLGDLEVLKSLFEAFQEKREILYLLDECVNADGVRLFIGDESGSAVLEHCSVVSAPYRMGGQVVGVLGVIGPTRMAYDRVISVVEGTAEALSAILNRED